MNRIKTIFSIFTITLILTSCLNYRIVFAKPNYINNLKSKIEKTNTEDINNSIDKIYKDHVVHFLIGHKQDLVYSNVSDQAITDATLSDPIPIFGSKTNYKNGDDYKSKLMYKGWHFVVYADSKPITVFSVNKQNGEYVVSEVFNENFARSYSNAMSQLDSKTLIVLPVDGRFFIANTNDNVALVKSQNSIDTEYGVKTFDELNEAANKAIDYNTNQKGLMLGGSMVIDYLYSNSTTNNSSSVSYAILFAIIGVCLVTVAIIFRIRKFKHN